MLKDLFVKDIDRDINGVIQAGQLSDSQVAQELDEYVVTEELADHLLDLLQHYTNSYQKPTDKMGVWISGFFGSGKSHFLKILSYLFGQRSALGKAPIDYFRDKPLTPELMRLIQEVGAQRADALLFNIESKTAVGNRNQRQSVVEVFLRVFNESLGYSDTLWIAEIEHILAREEKLTEFVDAVLRITGKEWSSVRDTLALKQGPFVQALLEVGYDERSAQSFFKTMQQTFEVSPENFAKRMAEHCRQQGPEYRLLFLVDEIGQYIGDDRKLMLNLQTVVEDLGTHGQGQVWVMVTSQESIDTVTAVRDYDFSKIQGRFRTRVNLSSTNTDDVIKWRILQKTDDATARLRVLFDQQEQSLRNMLSFDTLAMKAGFPTSEEFAASYPFQPYQFELLQKVFEKVRKQGEAGKSLSHGERSLLNAFQEALQQLDRARGVGALSTFAQFYDTIETFLDGPVKSTVRRAANRSELSAMDVQVLKALYLIKNLSEMPATVGNVTTLMIDSMDAVRRDLEKQVHESLDRLVLYHLIAQNADATFTFLSDEEQEINREIASIRIDPVQLATKLGQMFFSDVCPPKYKAEGGRDFDFSKRFDSYTHGVPSHALTLHVVLEASPDHAQLLSIPTGMLVMALPIEHTGYRDAMEQSLKIAQYIRKDLTTLSESQRRIVLAKRDEIVSFENRARTLLKAACQDATFYVLGQGETYNGEAESQINRAMAKLVANTYTHLSYIDTPVDMNNEGKKIAALALFGAEGSTTDARRNELALQAMARYLEERQRQQVPVTVDDLITHYTAPPYGWMDRDTVGLVAVLLHDGQLKLTHMGKPLMADDVKFADKVLKAVERKQVVVKLLREVPAEVQSRVRRVLLEHFEQAPAAYDSYEALAQFIRAQVEDRIAEPLRRVRDRQTRPLHDPSFPYPGAIQAQRLQGQVNGLLAPHDAESFVQTFLAAEADLEDWMTQIRQLDSFFSRSPIEQFDRAVSFLLEHRSDWAFVTDRSEIMAKKGQIESILRSESPYRRIPELPGLIHELGSAFASVLEEKRAQFRPKIEEARATVAQLGGLYPGHLDIQGIVAVEQSRIEEYVRHMEAETRLSSVGSYVQEAEHRVDFLRAEIRKAMAPTDGVNPPSPKSSGEDQGPVTGKPESDTLSRRRERVTTWTELSERVLPSGELRIESQGQIDSYLDMVKRELGSMLQDHVVIIRR